MDTVRTFIAVPVAGPAAHSVADLVDEMRKVGASVKWVETRNLHLTLKFLGDLPLSRIPALAGAVRKAVEGDTKFEMTLQGAGAFPDVTRARTLWVGVDRGAQRLAGLAEAVDRATVDAGFAPADKAFRPHLTIGRARERSAGAGISRIISENADIYLGAVDVKAIHICSSKLTPSGPIYTSLAEIPLE